MPPKIKPKSLHRGEDAAARRLLEGPEAFPEHLKSPMDLFSRKSKPPDVNFINKNDPETTDMIEKRAEKRQQFRKYQTKQTDPNKQPNAMRHTGLTR